MFPIDDPDPWRWSCHQGGRIDFCVAILVNDGLHAGPFTCHGPGHGRLRAAGMTPADWLSWLHEVVSREAAVHLAAQRLPRINRDALRALGPDPEPGLAMRLLRRHIRERSRGAGWKDLDRLARRAGDVVGAWQGAEAVRGPLRQAMRDWRRSQRGKGSRATVGPVLTTDPNAELEHRLYEDFRAARPRPPMLIVHLVPYPVSVLYVVPPVSLVIGAPHGRGDRALVEEGFGRLAAAQA